MTRILFIVPALNEERNVAGVVTELLAEFPNGDVLVIDDGSTDRTAEVAEKAGATVARHPFNLGIGSAHQTGFIFAVRHRYDLAVQVDSDGQHHTPDVRALLQPLLDGHADVTIGSRFLDTLSYRPPLFRRLGILLFSMVNTLLTGKRIADSTSGFRAHNAAAIAFLARTYPHDYPEPESVLLLAMHGYRLREVAVSMRPRQSGSSSITLLRSLYYVAKVLVAIGIGATRRRAGRRIRES